MQEKDFYLYMDGQPIPVSEEVYREYYRAENKERYFMGRLKKGHTTVDPDTQQIQYIPSRGCPMSSFWNRTGSSLHWMLLTRQEF